MPAIQGRKYGLTAPSQKIKKKNEREKVLLAYSVITLRCIFVFAVICCK